MYVRSPYQVAIFQLQEASLTSSPLYPTSCSSPSHIPFVCVSLSQHMASLPPQEETCWAREHQPHTGTHSYIYLNTPTDIHRPPGCVVARESSTQHPCLKQGDETGSGIMEGSNKNIHNLTLYTHKYDKVSKIGSFPDSQLDSCKIFWILLQHTSKWLKCFNTYKNTKHKKHIAHSH